MVYFIKVRLYTTKGKNAKALTDTFQFNTLTEARRYAANLLENGAFNSNLKPFKAKSIDVYKGKATSTPNELVYAGQVIMSKYKGKTDFIYMDKDHVQIFMSKNGKLLKRV